MHGSGEFAYALAAKGLIDEYEVYLNPLAWGEGNVHVLGDRGTVRMQLGDVKRLDSGVVLPTSRLLDRGWGAEPAVVGVGRLCALATPRNHRPALNPGRIVVLASSDPRAPARDARTRRESAGSVTLGHVG